MLGALASRRVVGDRRGLSISLVLGLLLTAGCKEEPLPPPNRPPPAVAAADLPSSPSIVYAPDSTSGSARDVPERRVVAAVPDLAFAGDEPIAARRVVYRVTLKVTPGMGSTVSALRAETIELYIDVSRDRLRATFMGQGWPVPPGSQVRIRRDQPGVYLFDGTGGRPLGPGQMASWFRGGRVPNSPRLWVRLPQGRLEGAGPLICRLVAEWAKSSVDDLARRCTEGGTPPAFRIGPWLAERTADVEVRLPRHALRADEKAAPRPIPYMTSGAIVPSSVMVHLRPRWRGPRLADAGPNPTYPLEVTNAGRRRMIVIMNGTAVGWLDSGTTAVFHGLRAGSYRLGAMDPFGPQNAPLRPTLVPGSVRLPR